MLWSCDVEASEAKGAGGDCGDPGGAAGLRASSGFGDHLVMWDESCQSFRFFQRSRELPDQCSHPTPRRPGLRTVSCRSTPRPGGAWSLRKGPSWLQVGWEVRPAEGPRASQQTCLGMGQLSPVWLQKQQPWQALRDPLGPSEVMVPVLELFGAKQTDRQKQALPTVAQRRQVARAQRPGGGSPGSLCLLFLNPLVSCAKIHSQQTTPGYQQAPAWSGCQLTATVWG